MKKRYITPEMKVHNMSLTKIICGSEDEIIVNLCDEPASGGEHGDDGL
jgi:hypothetical protein